MTPERWARARIVLATLAIGVAADQAIKVAASHALSGGALRLAGGALQLRSIENRGAMLSLGAGLGATPRVWLFSIVECALLAGLAAYAVTSSEARRRDVWAVALVIAGAAGNVVDRLALGHVRDYALIGIPGLPTAAFNLADVLVVGGGLLLLAAAFAGRAKATGAVAALGIAVAIAVPAQGVEPPAAGRGFPARLVKLGGAPADPSVQAHVAYSRKLGFNALWVYSGEAGRWTKEDARWSVRLDPDFVRLARQARADGMDVWVSINPIADSRGRFVFSEPAGERRILAFTKKLRAKAGVTHVVISFDDQPTELTEFRDLVRYGPSAAPAEVDLVRRLAAALPPDTSLWFCASAYCDAHLADGQGPYSKPFLEALPRLPASVGMVWTGPKVVSPSITRADIEATRARLGGRPILLYDNFPANDDDPDDALALILGALRNRDPGLRDAVAAYLACPMSELGGSRLSLATTASWLADPDAYDPKLAAAAAIAALAGPNAAARTALETQQLEWGGWIEGLNYWPRDALNAVSAGRRLADPAFVESFTWTADRYPGRMQALMGLADVPFRDDLLRAMARRLVVARAMPLAVEYAARVRAGRADAAEVLAQIDALRAATQDAPDASRILARFLRAADVPSR